MLGLLGKSDNTPRGAEQDLAWVKVREETDLGREQDQQKGRCSDKEMSVEVLMGELGHWQGGRKDKQHR